MGVAALAGKGPERDDSGEDVGAVASYRQPMERPLNGAQAGEVLTY